MTFSWANVYIDLQDIFEKENGRLCLWMNERRIFCKSWNRRIWQPYSILIFHGLSYTVWFRCVWVFQSHSCVLWWSDACMLLNGLVGWVFIHGNDNTEGTSHQTNASFWLNVLKETFQKKKEKSQIFFSNTSSRHQWDEIYSKWSLICVSYIFPPFHVSVMLRPYTTITKFTSSRASFKSSPEYLSMGLKSVLEIISREPWDIGREKTPAVNIMNISASSSSSSGNFISHPEEIIWKCSGASARSGNGHPGRCVHIWFLSLHHSTLGRCHVRDRHIKGEKKWNDPRVPQLS